MNTEEIDVEDDKDLPAHKTLWGGLRLLKWMGVVLGVLLLGNFTRSFILQDMLERTEDAVSRTEVVALGAKTSADSALQELRAAIAAIQESDASEPDLSNRAIIDALQAIARIEVFVCGGPCPEVGST